MQTLIIDSLKVPLLLVWGLPEGAKVADNNAISHRLPKCGVIHYTHLPEGNWQLIGKLSELTEEQAKELIHVSLHSGLSAHYTKGVNPTNVYCYNSSLESFHSAIEAEGHYVKNPWPEPEIENHLSGRQYKHFLRKWQEDKSKTLPANTLIFKRS